MGLSIGIVGLPNVGKSTIFNALTKAQNATSANYPFCTIEPNKATVPMPDSRIDKLSEIIHPQNIVYSTVDFIDIAGLVKGASKGEGLGNQFLANIREVDAILHVVRCFENTDIIHVEGEINPLRDIEIINTELILADVQSLSTRIERLNKQARIDKKLQPKLDLAKEILEYINQGNFVSTFLDRGSDFYKELMKEVSLITNKKVIFCMNIDENNLAKGNIFTQQVQEFAKNQNSSAISISARMEEEFIGLSNEEALEFMESFGVTESGLGKIIRTGFEILGLCSYFTAGVKEVRAWTIQEGWKAPKAASAIHTDFERGFIRAEIVSYDDFIKYGSELACKNAGVLRSEGKEYIVKDGDIVHFLFNV